MAAGPTRALAAITVHEVLAAADRALASAAAPPALPRFPDNPV
jgi:hypothetical protein